MKLNKYTKTIRKPLTDLIDILINLFIFTLLAGLVFDDIFGVLGRITNMLSNISSNGVSALLGLMIIYTYIKK